jgi:hypothetical protein
VQGKDADVDALEDPIDVASEVDTKPIVPEASMNTEEQPVASAISDDPAPKKADESSVPALTPDVTPTPAPEPSGDSIEPVEKARTKDSVKDAVEPAIKEPIASRVASPAPKTSAKSTPRNRKGKKGKEKAPPPPPADKDEKADPPERSAVGKSRLAPKSNAGEYAD